MPSKHVMLLLLCLAFMLPACAFDVYNLPKQPTQLQPAAADRPSLLMARDLEVTPPGGFRRIIRGGTAWTLVGTCPQGEVYSSKDQVLTVEASHVHEAYLTVRQGRLIGFYLPVERAFVALGYEAQLPINNQ